MGGRTGHEDCTGCTDEAGTRDDTRNCTARVHRTNEARTVLRNED